MAEKMHNINVFLQSGSEADRPCSVQSKKQYQWLPHPCLNVSIWCLKIASFFYQHFPATCKIQQFNWVLCHNFEPNKHNSSRTFWSGSSLTNTVQVLHRLLGNNSQRVMIEEQLTNTGNTCTHLCLEHVCRALQVANVMCATLLSIHTINLHLHAKNK